ncbi:MAG: two-component sensor histidine kinase [Bacteroidetes bacterium B1(2017)]|nr:MAG: two-component sensor histidine kinase [Bacteroidetes bacterium B1(2017)]
MSRVSLFITIFLPITSVFAHLFSISWPFGIVNTINSVYLAYLVFSSRKSLTATKWVVILSMILTTVCGVIYVSLHKYNVDLYNVYEKIISTPLLLSSPLALLFYVSFRFREILQEVAKEAQKVLKITEEKNNILATQNETLERKVEARTAELKASQAQLIQSEKLASLGELTAGIAHEIQNPLNFVNNFSEVSSELIDEMNQEMNKGDINEAKVISNDLKQNLEKITLHGKRASSIVKGMLEHSRNSTGEKELTDINELADDYLRLAYHGLRAKDSSFNADFKTDFDENLPKIEVIPQDMGRVLLNLINNAFWAVNERSKKGETGFEPKVNVTTHLTANSQMLIDIKDNGKGMSEVTKTKIFQPFFTTKPTDQGTGLGLSLAYDIVTKGHGGTIEVETKEGEGTTFTIKLPIQNK